LKKGAKVLK